jgi:uncharacterized membrane protein YgcG
MDSTTSAAHRRVGAAAVLAFLALLLLGVARNSAQADPVLPAATPAAAPTVQPQQQVPPFARPRDHDGDGFGHRGDGDGGGGFGGGGMPGGGGSSGGGGTAPAPSTGGSKT